jgi:hypothetical protein
MQYHDGKLPRNSQLGHSENMRHVIVPITNVLILGQMIQAFPSEMVGAEEHADF